MEDSPRVEDLLARAIDEQLAEQRSWRDALDLVAARLARLELALDELRAELPGLAEAGARAAVADELAGATGELRRQLSDLGRLLVNDLGRLPQLVRDAVAAGLSAPQPAVEPTVVAGTTVPGDGPIPVVPGSGTADPGIPDPDPDVDPEPGREHDDANAGARGGRAGRRGLFRGR